MIKKVIDILADFTTLEKDMITEKTSLVTDLGLSSLDVINVVVAVSYTHLTLPTNSLV